MRFKLSKAWQLRSFLLLFLSFLLACDSRTEWRDGNYHVIWIDSPSLSLNYDLGNGATAERISADVIAVGSDSRYVVAKQRHPQSKNISFFVIEKSKDARSKDAKAAVIGPMSQSEFLLMSQGLGLPNFTKEFHY